MIKIIKLVYFKLIYYVITYFSYRLLQGLMSDVIINMCILYVYILLYAYVTHCLYFMLYDLSRVYNIKLDRYT